jgi:hypothetical protein
MHPLKIYLCAGSGFHVNLRLSVKSADKMAEIPFVT